MQANETGPAEFPSSEPVLTSDAVPSPASQLTREYIAYCFTLRKPLNEQLTDETKYGLICDRLPHPDVALQYNEHKDSKRKRDVYVRHCKRE